MKHIIFKKVCRYVVDEAFSWLLVFIWKLFFPIWKNRKWFPYQILISGRMIESLATFTTNFKMNPQIVHSFSGKLNDHVLLLLDFIKLPPFSGQGRLHSGRISEKASINYRKHRTAKRQTFRKDLVK